ncbi:MAG: hypothetical protein ACO3EG_07500 [Chitinophagaceae bacterium]
MYSGSVIYYNEEFLNGQRSKNKNILDVYGSLDMYSLCQIGRIFRGNSCINRLGDNFNLPVNFSYTPIPKDYETDLSFEDVCLTVAQEIWEKTDKVSLFWSGGIDSTTILVSLMMTNSDWKNCIEVYANKISVEKEYPFFYNTFLVDANVRILSTAGRGAVGEYSSYYGKELFKDKYVTDGQCGDWLWASGIINEHPDFKSGYEIIYDNIRQNWEHSQIIIDYIEKVISFSPVKIESIFDLSWWIAFTHRWDFPKIIHTMQLKDLDYLYAMKPFFDHELFQKWSMSNHDKKVKDTLTTLKWPAKDLIYKYTKDENYRANKKQRNSITHGRCYSSDICIVRESGVVKTATLTELF